MSKQFSQEQKSDLLGSNSVANVLASSYIPVQLMGGIKQSPCQSSIPAGSSGQNAVMTEDGHCFA